MPYPCLFSPFKVRDLVTPNRVLLAPMGNNLSDSKGTITLRSIAYYIQRARDGVGMIITEAVGDCPRAWKYSVGHPSRVSHSL
jgi:2,4-dienoyl-CoA reductase-like NADH-dependent reductase (Old Yellow Enzyme family)